MLLLQVSKTLNPDTESHGWNHKFNFFLFISVCVRTFGDILNGNCKDSVIGKITEIKSFVKSTYHSFSPSNLP